GSVHAQAGLDRGRASCWTDSPRNLARAAWCASCTVDSRAHKCAGQELASRSSGPLGGGSGAPSARRRSASFVRRMPDLIALVVVVVFAALSAIHAYWAFGGKSGMVASVPELNNRPAFVPSARSTFAVAVGLALCAALVAASAGFILSSPPAPWV